MNSHSRDDAFLQGECALVTGASRGIGRAIALGLARAGAAVALTARSGDELELAAGEVRAAGGRAVAIPADISDEATPALLVQRTVAEFGRLTILVNNAGVGVYGRVEQMTADDFDAVMRVNARAPFLLCREAIAPMRGAGGGTIINVSSVVGVKGYVRQGLYTASKHALMGFSKVLAQEVQRDGIRVHTICPGGVDTDMAGQARPDLDRSILMKPDEVAEVALFLLSMKGAAVIDDVHLRRATGEPWF